MKRELPLSALEALPLAVMLLDERGAVSFVNEAFERLTGTVFESIRGKELQTLSSLTVSGSVPALDEEAYYRDASWLAGDGVVTLVEVEVHLVNGGGVALFLHPSGGTESRDRRRERMESLGRLTGGIAHDLNNILTGVLGHVSVLQWALPDAGQHTESLKAIEDGARRAAGLLNQILEFAKGEEGKYGLVEMAPLVRAAFNLFKAALPKNIEVHFVEGAEGLAVLGDEGQLSQLVMNLAVNARDALPNGGQITLAISCQEVVEPSVRAALERACGSSSGRFVCFSVADNGTGIPKELQERIFEPFFTTKAAKGTGLGLANVAAIAKAHGGTITVQSAPGQGTVFEVYLPECVVEVGTPAERTTEPLAEALPVGGERILVVEDEEVVRLVMERCLEHLGYEVQVAEDGPEAIALYSQAPQGTYRLVILDMMMPKMSGDEVFTELLKLDPAVRVLVSSGYSTDGRAQAVLDRGGMGFIPKPFAIEDLAREVRRCLDTER